MSQEEARAIAQGLQAPAAVALANEGQQIAAAVARVRTMPLPDQAAVDQFAAGLVQVKERRQALKSAKDAELAPHLLDSKIIRAKYKPVEGAYEALDEAMRERFGRHTQEQQTARVAAQQAAGAAFQSGDQAGAYQALLAAPTAAEADGVGVGEVWDFEITNEGMVPREYCEPVPKLIRATFKPSQKDPPAFVPGVRFFRRAQVRVTG